MNKRNRKARSDLDLPGSESGSEPVRVMRIIARLNVGGPAIHVSLLTVGLQDAAYQSTLVTGVVEPDEGDMTYLARDLGIEPVVIPTLRREISPIADLKTLAALVRLMHRLRPHVVHTHTAKAGFVGRLAAALCHVPVVVHTFHGHIFKGYFGRAKTLLFIWLERLAARGSDVILTVSQRLKDDLVAYGIAPEEKIKIVPLGLKLLPLTDLDALRGSFRREGGFSTETPLVGIIGRLVPIKNHELFLAAASQVSRVRPEVRFAIIGDGERREVLEALVEESGLAGRVCFAGWRDDLPRIYADLDVVVISSNNEGTPVSIIEAMAARVPVVATSVGGVPDLLREGQLGTLVPPEDAGAMAEAILRTLSAPLQPRLAEAQEWALARYEADRLIADVRQLYDGLLRGKGVGPPGKT
jgi:glycosyltransferase involved in cell wall biosynthesis